MQRRLLPEKTAGLCSDYAIKGALPSGVELAGSGETGMAVTTCKTRSRLNTTVVLMPKIYIWVLAAAEIRLWKK